MLGHQGAWRGILACLLGGLLLLFVQADAKETKPDAQMRAATEFFTRLAQDSLNPYISAMARDSLMRLSRKSVGKRYAIPLMSQPDDSIAVAALLNEKVMGTFLVDTGASYTMITPELAGKLGIVITDKTPRISILTANGSLKAPRVTLKKMSVGALEVENVPVIVQGLNNDPLLAGLLGMSVFQGKSLTIQKDRLILEESPIEY